MNRNEPAFPMFALGKEPSGVDRWIPIEGLTKREYAAIHIAAGMAPSMFTRDGMEIVTTFIERGDVKDSSEFIRNVSINVADLVLAALAKGEKP